VQPLGEHVAPPLIGLAHVFDALLRAFEGDHRRHLDRREGAVVVIALDAHQRPAQLFVADHVADPPAGHVVALGHGEELDRDLARARDLQDRRCLIAVEDDIGVGQVMDHQNVVLPGQRDDALEEFEVYAAGGRIARKAENHHLRFRRRLDDAALQLGEKSTSGVIGTERMSAPAMIAP
jgi:hypothetical protein